MRVLLRRLLGVGRRTSRPPGAGYRSAAYRRLWPSQVRARRFTPVKFGRPGVDPVEVAEFLEQVAGDLAWAYTELARTREQNARIKGALRRWQARSASSAHELAGR